VFAPTAILVPVRVHNYAAAVPDLLTAPAESLLRKLLVALGSRPPTQRSALEDRISALTGALRQSATVIADIEQEIAARKALVNQLEADAAHAECLVRLHSTEVEAVAQLLRGEIAEADRRNLRATMWLSLIFFVKGSAVTVGVTLLAA
jgi:hypothetical protein